MSRYADVAPEGAYPPATDSLTGRGGPDARGALLHAGLRDLKNRQYVQATRTLLQAVLADPNAGVPKLAFGDALFAVGDYDYAAYAIRRGIDRVDHMESALANRRELFSSPDELDRLLYALRHHVQENPADGDAHLLLGYYQYVSARLDEANRSFEKALTIDGNDRHAARLRDHVRAHLPQ